MRTAHHLQSFDFPNEDTKRLFQAILELQSVEDCESFFRDLCTLPELKALSERWKIALFIWQGFPYRTIIRETGASSTTIARVSHWLQYGNGGFRRMCQKQSKPIEDANRNNIVAPGFIRHPRPLVHR